MMSRVITWFVGAPRCKQEWCHVLASVPQSTLGYAGPHFYTIILKKQSV